MTEVYLESNANTLSEAITRKRSLLKSTNRGSLIVLLEELKKSTIPTLLIMGDRDIGFHVEDWYPLIGDLKPTQVIVLPRWGHAPHHQYPDLVANYITGFIHGWK